MSIDLDAAIVGHRKLRNLGMTAELLSEQVDELLTGDDFPGTENAIATARHLQDGIRWILGEPELEHRAARARHLLEHGVRVIERLLDATTHEHDDEDVARGWITRVKSYTTNV